MRHEQCNDALLRNNRIAVARYKFAIECLGSGKKIVDLACGMGYGSHLLRAAGNEVVGFDYLAEAIDYAREHYPGKYAVVNLEEEIIRDDFDAGVCLEVICHLHDPQKFIDNLKMKELVISAPIDPDPKDGYFYRLHHLSEDQFKNMFKDWNIVKEFRQKKYLALHLIKK
jgi:SAM-dependent methyltransferase